MQSRRQTLRPQIADSTLRPSTAIGFGRDRSRASVSSRDLDGARVGVCATALSQVVARKCRGFTLIELLIVMVIIGILLAFILNAAMDGIRRGEERATQALISKIEVAISDRIEAINNLKLDATAAHYYLGSVSNTNYTSRLPINYARGMVIAQFDKLKAEFPDVFYPQNNTRYPLNFAAVGYPGAESPYSPTGFGPYLLPLGVGIINNANGDSAYAISFGGNTNDPINTSTLNTVNPIYPVSTGIFGASYGARGGFAKQLGSLPTGYDGIDNNGNGLIDETGDGSDGEWGMTADTVLTNLKNNHTHTTARSETLYAVLTEGVGPLGSVFDPSDFNDSEVRDTDGDGLLEFVDAWGEPLQFYRWPIYYHGQGHPTDVGYAPATQRGYLPYPSALVNREQNPLDPNQLLVSPDWWSNSYNNANTSTAPYAPFDYDPMTPFSPGVVGFTRFFMPLTDPYAYTTFDSKHGYWDRGSSFYQRREFYSRFLLVSGGPDKTPGVAVLDKPYFTKLDAILAQENDYLASIQDKTTVVDTTSNFQFPTYDIETDTAMMLIESQGGSVTPFRSPDLYQTPLSITGTKGHPQITGAIQAAGHDDITNHNLQAPSGATQ